MLLPQFTVHVTAKNFSFERHNVKANSADMAEQIVRLKLQGKTEIAVLTVFDADGEIVGDPVRCVKSAT